jgi:HPt (histidine-containing phosphotransfer) domain-containing protein
MNALQRLRRGRGAMGRRPPPWPAIDGLDAATAARCLGDRADVHRLVLRQFAARAEGIAQESAVLFARGDLPGLLHVAHSMKGSAPCVGAVELSRRAGLLERALRAGRPAAEIGAACGEMLDELQAVRRSILRHLPDEEAAPAAGRDETPQEALARIEALVRMADYEAITGYRQSAALLRAHFGQRLGGVEEALGAFDFDRALAAIQALA